MSSVRFAAALLAVGAVTAYLLGLIGNEYAYYAGYIVVQYVVLATAWNILGGYAGYVNFGTAAFFAIGVYSSVAIGKFVDLPVPVLMLVAGMLCAAIGLGVGFLTLRLRGVYFSIATLALSVVVQTLIINWDFVGGSRGAYVIRPEQGPMFGSYIAYLFMLMLGLALAAVFVARSIEKSNFGLGLSALRDDEIAAAASGVPTLRLKLIATVISGGLMGMAGAPFPFYVTYVDPASSFNLAYTVNSIAMPVVGGLSTWVGPVIGAILLASLQQWATVSISSSANLLIVGGFLVVFVVVAPNGLVGLFRRVVLRKARP